MSRAAFARSGALLLALAGSLMGCGGAQQAQGTTVTTVDMEEEVITAERPARPRVAPPEAGPASDLRFPAIVRATCRVRPGRSS